MAAVARAAGRALNASSVGADVRGPMDRPSTKPWPIGGVRHRVVLFAPQGRGRAAAGWVPARAPEVRVVRRAPAWIFQRGAASGIRRLEFAAPFRPSRRRPRWIPIVPATRGCAFQAGPCRRCRRRLPTRRRLPVGTPAVPSNRRRAGPPPRRGRSAASWTRVPSPSRPGRCRPARQRRSDSAPLVDATGLGGHGPCRPARWTAHGRGSARGWQPQRDAGAALLELSTGPGRQPLPTPTLQPGGDGRLRARESLPASAPADQAATSSAVASAGARADPAVRRRPWTRGGLDPRRASLGPWPRRAGQRLPGHRRSAAAHRRPRARDGVRRPGGERHAAGLVA